MRKIKVTARKLRKGDNAQKRSILKGLPGYLLGSLVRLVKHNTPHARRQRHYVHYLHEHRKKTASLMPMQQLTKKVGILSISLLIISSISSNGAFLGSTYAAEGYNQLYLSEEDIAFNLERLVTTEEGFLIKSMPQAGESVKIERLEKVQHEVQDGQTLAQIAALYELATDTIIWENNIVSVENIKPGQSLVIPPTDGITHVVERGETISHILAKYEESEIDKIRRFNELGSGTLTVGQEVYVPAGKKIAPTVIASALPADEPGDRVANVTLDIDASVPPSEPEPVPTPQIIRTPDKVPTPNVAPIQGVTGETSIVQETIAVPTIQEAAPIPASLPVAAGVQFVDPTGGNAVISQGYRAGHWALDMSNRSKPPIYAAAGGVVIKATFEIGRAHV